MQVGLQHLDSEQFRDASDLDGSVRSRTILAKRIIEMADQGLMDVTELRDDGISACLLTRAFDRREAEAAGIGMAPLRHRRANLVL